MTQQTADSFLLGGGGGRSAKFEQPGTTVTGLVIDSEVRQQTDIRTGEPKVWQNGDPMNQLVVRLQTDTVEDADDDGIRVLYIKGGFKAPTMQKAVADAVRGVGAKGLEPGGSLSVTYTGDGPKSPGMNPPKYYTATYNRPAAGAAFLAPPAPQQAAPQHNEWNTPAPAPTPAAARTDLPKMPDGTPITPEMLALLQQVSKTG